MTFQALALAAETRHSRDLEASLDEVAADKARNRICGKCAARYCVVVNGVH